MILKNVYKLNAPTINLLEALKEPGIHSLIANTIHHVIDRAEFGAKDVYILIHDMAVDTYYQFILKPTEYKINGILDNEVDTFNIITLKTDLKSIQEQLVFGSTISFDPPYAKKVVKIIIFGEERTRNWNSKKTILYFGENINQQVSDYLFAPQYIIFQFSDDTQLVFKSDRDSWTIKYTKAFEKSMYDGYYEYSQINMKEEEEWNEMKLQAPPENQLEELPIFSEEKIIKKLYEFKYK